MSADPVGRGSVGGSSVGGGPFSKGSFSVDREVCRGSGLCQAMSPALFGRTADGYPALYAGELRDEDSVRLADEVADCCPTGAIAVHVHAGDGDSATR